MSSGKVNRIKETPKSFNKRGTIVSEDRDDSYLLRSEIKNSPFRKDGKQISLVYQTPKQAHTPKRGEEHMYNCYSNVENIYNTSNSSHKDESINKKINSRSCSLKEFPTDNGNFIVFLFLKMY